MLGYTATGWDRRPHGRYEGLDGLVPWRLEGGNSKTRTHKRLQLPSQRQDSCCNQHAAVAILRPPFRKMRERMGHPQELLVVLVGDGCGGCDAEVECDAGLAGGVGLGGADPEVDGADGDEAFALWIDDGELAGSE